MAWGVVFGGVNVAMICKLLQERTIAVTFTIDEMVRSWEEFARSLCETDLAHYIIIGTIVQLQRQYLWIGKVDLSTSAACNE